MKKIVTILLLIGLVNISAAQPLQDFEFSSNVDDEDSLSVTGGETVDVDINFENQVGRDLPMVLRLEVSNNDIGVIGEEFELTASSNSSNENEFRALNLSCSSRNISYSSAVWTCMNQSSDEVLSRYQNNPSSNNINLQVKAVENIAPGNYEYELNVLSKIGEGPVRSRMVNSSGENIEVGSVSIGVRPGSKANVSVQSLDSISSSPGGQFVGGASVDVNSNSGETRASGTVVINYEDEEFDDYDLSVYYYNESETIWENVGGEHYPSNNSIVAQVDHFSTYAVFGKEEEETEDEGDSGSDGSTIITPVQDGNEDDAEQTEPQDEQQEDENQGQNEDQQEGPNQQDESGPEIPGEELPENTPGNNITGQFLGSPTNIAALIVGLFVAMIAALEYSGKIELKALIVALKEKVLN